MSRQLKTSSNDLAIVEGQLVIVEGQTDLAQSVRQRLQTYRGEWRYDLSAGVPFNRVSAKGQLDIAKQIYREVILETPGVTGIRRLELAFDNATRTLTITGEITGVDDAPMVFSPVQIQAGS